MFKKLLFTLASLFLVTSFIGPTFAFTGSKNVTATYNNIKIVVDGKVINTSEEPFVINGVTYVPLRVVSGALDAQVDWDGKNNQVIITTKDSKPSEEAALDSSTTGIKEDKSNEIDNSNEAAKDTAAAEIDEDTAFANLLLERHGILKGVYFKEFAVEGDKREVSLDITLELSENIEAWSALTDQEVSVWLAEVAEDVQKAYDEDTEVKGRIIREENKDAIIEFEKDGDEKLKTRFYDGNYRTGVAVKTKLTVEKEYVGKHFYVQGINFIVTSVNYRSDYDTVDVVLSAVESNAQFDWDKLSTRETKQAVKEISQTVVDDFENANISLEKVNTTFKDKRNRGLGLYFYNVEEDTVK